MEPTRMQESLCHQGHQTAHRRAHHDGRRRQAVAHLHQVLDHALRGVVAVHRPVGLTVAPEVDGPCLVPAIGEHVRDVRPAVPGLSATVQQDDGRSESGRVMDVDRQRETRARQHGPSCGTALRCVRHRAQDHMLQTGCHVSPLRPRVSVRQWERCRWRRPARPAPSPSRRAGSPARQALVDPGRTTGPGCPPRSPPLGVRRPWTAPTVGG